MGNGEQYIWKPPEDDDIITLHRAPASPGENGQGYTPTAMEVMDVTVCVGVWGWTRHLCQGGICVCALLRYIWFVYSKCVLASDLGSNTFRYFNYFSKYISKHVFR